MTEPILQPENEEDDFRDQFGLWRHAQQVQYPEADFNIKMTFASHRTLHRKYNDALKVHRPNRFCPGLGFMRPKHVNVPLFPCLEIGCPSCWFRRRAELFSVVQQCQHPYFYLKVIESDWEHPVDPDILKSFKRDGSVMQLIGHMVGLDVDEDQGWTQLPPGTELAVSRHELMPIYRLVGAFASDRRIRPKRSKPYADHPDRFQMHFYGDSAKYSTSVIDYYEFVSVEDLLETWLRFDPYPYQVSTAVEYSEVIQSVNMLFGRSGRVNTQVVSK